MNDTTAAEALLGVQDLYARHAECICDGELERWPDFFTESCVYKIASRVNVERGLPLAPFLAESRGALRDRVVAIRNTMVFAPRCVTHAVSGVRIAGREGALLRTRSMFCVYQTLEDGATHIQLAGRTFDTIDTAGAEWLFAERVVVYDTDLVPGSVVYPV